MDNLVLDTKRKRKRKRNRDEGGYLYFHPTITDVMEQILAYICQPQIILHNCTYASNQVNTWNVRLKLATLNGFGRNFVLVNHETRKAVYDCVLQTSWEYHVGLIKDIMFDVFVTWLWNDSRMLLVFDRKPQDGPPSEEIEVNAFTFAGEHIDISTDEDPGHTILQIRFYEKDADGNVITSSSGNFEKKCRFGDMAKYMSDQMFTEKINKHLADRVFANHLAIETRLLESKYAINKAKLLNKGAFGN
jgi:hypothetical protein